MAKLKNALTHPAVWLCLIIIAGALFCLGDMYYDFVLTPEAAIGHCGEKNIEAVSMTGFYKRDIICFSDGLLPQKS